MNNTEHIACQRPLLGFVLLWTAINRLRIRQSLEPSMHSRVGQALLASTHAATWNSYAAHVMNGDGPGYAVARLLSPASLGGQGSPFESGGTILISEEVDMREKNAKTKSFKPHWRYQKRGFLKCKIAIQSQFRAVRRATFPMSKAGQAMHSSVSPLLRVVSVGSAHSQRAAEGHDREVPAGALRLVGHQAMRGDAGVGNVALIAEERREPA